MTLEPWERAFLAALERSGPINAPGGLVEAGRDRMNDRPVQSVYKRATGKTRNGWGARRDTRVSGWERGRRKDTKDVE